MLKIAHGKIDLPHSLESLESVLIEGRDGGESRVTDEAIANWCYEFYLGFHPRSNEDRHGAVALEVSTQWEADLGNGSGRVLSVEQYELWLQALGVNAPNNSLQARRP